MSEKKTAGQLSQEAWSADPVTDSIDELKDEATKEWFDMLEQRIIDGRKTYTGDFYICVLQKKEKLMQNIIRNFFFHRKTCPTPDYDQIVFQWDESAQELIYHWSIPNRDTCFRLLNDPLHVHPDHRELLDHVMDFKDGTLSRRAMILNGELKDNGIA